MKKYIHSPRRPCSKDISRWAGKKAGKTEWYPVIYPQIMPIMENTKMKVTSFDLYAIPNADDAQRCRIEIKWREREAADGGDHFILCGRKPEWCRWDCTMSALINLLKTAYYAVGNVKRVVLVTSLLFFWRWLIEWWVKERCGSTCWWCQFDAHLAVMMAAVAASERRRTGGGGGVGWVNNLASLPPSLRNPFLFPVKTNSTMAKACF